MNDSPYDLQGQFTGRVALVTGGSDGIGLDLARNLAKLGVLTHICGRSEEKGAAALAGCPDRLRFHRADLSHWDACVRLVDSVRQESDRLDYLVNNAADDARVPFEQVDADCFERMMAINLRPLFAVTRACLPLLRRGEGKSVVNISTTNYMLGLSPFTIYNAAKSGILGFTRSLARELGPEGIRANAVSPGWIMTPKQLRLYVTPEDQRDLLQAQCLKRLMTPRDVTPVVLFLLSNLSQGMTGQNLVVDGGKVMQ